MNSSTFYPLIEILQYIHIIQAASRQCKNKNSFLTLLFCIALNLHYICNVNALIKIVLMLAAAVLTPASSCAKPATDSLMLQRVLAYGQNAGANDREINSNVYVSYYLKTERRNFTLMAVPSMFYVARGKREYAGESYSNLTIRGGRIKKAVRQLNTGTIPHHKDAMETVEKYLMPCVYGVTMFGEQVLSPFNKANVRLYRYDITELTEGRTEIVFRPKRRNTQLISGSAIVDEATGRIMRTKFKGEYDLVDFSVDLTMGHVGDAALLPKACNIDVKFHFIGNKIRAEYHAIYDNPIALPDTIVNSHDRQLMAAVRPAPLPLCVREVYHTEDSLAAMKDTTTVEAGNEESWWKRVLWDSFGDYILNRTKGNFGSEGQGAFRLSPILNPLYLGYSGRRGVTYKLKLNASYKFSANSDLTLDVKAGYSFKQRQFYFSVPIKYNFNKVKNGFVSVEVGNGNRITNSSIVEQVKNEQLDSINWDEMNLDYFKDLYVKLKCNYDFSDKWSVQPGLVFHRRSAVDHAGFVAADRPTEYYSLAPSLQVQYRPAGWRGPVITADYERGVRVGKADMDYERYELDVSWIKRFHPLRSLSLRLGNGFYTSKSRNSYFLDYTNFREENIPGGWNDDWACEFQLLGSNWYNASEYYVRGNVTYESPLMILSRIPYVGRLMETERVYVNVLFVEHLHPYVEYGYGFTNRFFSMGVFMATSNTKFDGVGCRFGFELFSDW